MIQANFCRRNLSPNQHRELLKAVREILAGVSANAPANPFDIICGTSAGAVNAAAFWRRMGNPITHDAAGEVWVLGTGAADRSSSLQSLEAPDFSLPDLEGRSHTLSEHRGKKVLLATWASW